MGKAYTNKRPLEERPESDFYATPHSLTWELLKLNLLDKNKTCIEPASGEGDICRWLAEYFNKPVFHGDIRYGFDFLDDNNIRENSYDYCILNPPFSLFDEFVMQAKRVAREKVISIAKTNFFGAYQRYQNGVWKHLKHVYIFNRQVDYRYEPREDGKLKFGNLITGWFVWDLEWNHDWWMTEIIDIQKYALNSKDKKED